MTHKAWIIIICVIAYYTYSWFIITYMFNFIHYIVLGKNKNIFKYRKTDDLRKWLKTYATRKDKHPDIKFIMLVDNQKYIENCAKVFLENYSYKKGR